MRHFIPSYIIFTLKPDISLKAIIPISSRNRSRVIITSRYTHVARYIGGEGSITELDLLGEEESWKLFSKLIKSSSEDNNDNVIAAWKDIGVKIVNRCGGLPLAIEVVAGMLKQRRKNKREWNEVLDYMSRSAENSCVKILSLSYKDLPLELRPLFLYFGLFPEDSEIFVSDLSRVWAAEKLVQVDGSPNLEDTVASKIDNLVDRNLIKVSRRSLNDMITSCRIHDVLRSLCVDIAKENNLFFTLHNMEYNSVSRLRRLATDNDNLSQYLSSSFRAPKLRTLLWFVKDEPSGVSSGWCLIPNEIGKLSNLTCLKLNGSFIRMPSSISNLKKLVILDVQKAYFENAFPTSIFKKRCLKHLLLNRYIMFHFPNIRCANWNEVYLPNTETLDWIPSSALKPMTLRRLSNLVKLNLTDVTSKHIQVLSDSAVPILEKLQDLRLNDIQQSNVLKLSSYHNLVKLHLQFKNRHVMLDCIKFPPNLLELTLKSMYFEEDPMKVLKDLTRLEILKFDGCELDDSVRHIDCSGENSFLELQALAIIGGNYVGDWMSRLIVDQSGTPKLRKFLSDCGDEEVPERLRNILVRERPTILYEEDFIPGTLAGICWRKLGNRPPHPYVGVVRAAARFQYAARRAS